MKMCFNIFTWNLKHNGVCRFGTNRFSLYLESSYDDSGDDCVPSYLSEQIRSGKALLNYDHSVIDCNDVSIRLWSDIISLWPLSLLVGLSNSRLFGSTENLFRSAKINASQRHTIQIYAATMNYTAKREKKTQ